MHVLETAVSPSGCPRNDLSTVFFYLLLVILFSHFFTQIHELMPVLLCFVGVLFTSEEICFDCNDTRRLYSAIFLFLHVL